MTLPRHTCPATRIGLPCWHTDKPVATPCGTSSHLTFAALVELLHAVGEGAAAAWDAVRRRCDFVYGGVEYGVTS